MLKKKCLAFLFFLSCIFSGITVSAQNRQPGNTAYQIPQTVYVGDRAMLVLPLSDHALGSDIELMPPPLSSDDIELHRLVLESRPPGSRLLIEFTAFIPGRFELPPFEADGLRFSGLHLDISSIIADNELPVLSGLAPPLSVPGTGFFIYGVLSALAFVLAAAIWVSVWGRRYFKLWFSVWKRRRLVNIMMRIEKRMRKALASGKNYREILDVISAEFRNFLSLFSGENCRAMTSLELGQLPAGIFYMLPAESGPGFLEHFFGRCDTLRFGGAEISAGSSGVLLGELRNFLDSLNRALRKNRKQEKT